MKLGDLFEQNTFTNDTEWKKMGGAKAERPSFVHRDKIEKIRKLLKSGYSYDKELSDANTVVLVDLHGEQKHVRRNIYQMATDKFAYPHAFVESLQEDRYTDRWAKAKAAENKAALKAIKDQEKVEKLSQQILKRPPKEKKPDSFEIWRKASAAISNSFPDGDPIDHLLSFMNRYNLSMDDIDRAVRKHEKVKGGFYAWLAGMWDDTQGDQIHDAKNGHIDDNSPFYHVEGDKIVPADNPWK